MSDPYGELGYLHDCELLELSYVLTNPDIRRVILRLQANPDLGHPTWNGKFLRVTASGIYLFRWECWAHVWGNETLDRWNKGVSEITESELARDRALGFHVPELGFTVTFHSGSFLELICKSVSVEVITE